MNYTIRERERERELLLVPIARPHSPDLDLNLNQPWPKLIVASLFYHRLYLFSICNFSTIVLWYLSVHLQ
jgi:hypothetical protein